jgi:hypothetical protein
MTSNIGRSKSRFRACFPLRVSLRGTQIVAMACAVGAAIATSMSGCCGGAPSHSCMFSQMDAAPMDSTPDMGEVCGFDTCVPGRTYCCLKHNPTSLTCIPLSQTCDDMPCSSDSDCQAGSGLHCCEVVSTHQVQCMASCSGDLTDGTIRICSSSQECPPDKPTCGTVQVNNQTRQACVVGF